VNSSLRNPLNSESVDLRTTRTCSPEITWVAFRPTVTTQVRTSPPRLTNACWPSRLQAYCSTLHLRLVRGRARFEQPGAQRDRVVLDRGDAVQLGVGEGGVLLGVGGQHLALVTGRVRLGEVAAQRRRHVEVVDLVPRGVATNADDAVLRLAVLVGSQDRGHVGSTLVATAREVPQLLLACHGTTKRHGRTRPGVWVDPPPWCPPVVGALRRPPSRIPPPAPPGRRCLAA
jgi:hypothetical protein